MSHEKISTRLTRRAFGRAASMAAVALAPGWAWAAAREGPPGVVVAHVPAWRGQYVGSPGLAVLPSGDYLAKHDRFGPASSELYQAVTRVDRSQDRGETWSFASQVWGVYWAGIFTHQDAVFMIGTSRLFGDVVIVRSDDGGQTWTRPRDGRRGRLLKGFYHTAPTPVAIHQGRLYRAMEQAGGPFAWQRDFKSFMMSAPADADLLDAGAWTCSNRLAGDPAWLEGRFGGWLEGNAVVAPAGEVVNVLRVEAGKPGGVAALVKIGADGAEASFDPDAGFIAFPGGEKKFTIRHDERSGLYWSLVNPVGPDYRDLNPGSVRNTLALVSSPDLFAWTIRQTILHHPDPKRHAFQYADWLIDGADLIALSRTAYDDPFGGAHSAHDANFLTFHRIQNFRET